MIGAEQAIAAGYAAFKREDWTAARNALNGIAHVQAIHLLGLVEKGAGNYPLARQYLARAAELDPKNPEIANNQGLLARLTGELHVAEQAFRRALSLKSDFRSARLSLGRTLNGLEKHQEAMTELALLITQNSKDLAARVAYATSALDIQDWVAAHEQIEAALGHDPAHNGALYASGVLALHTGDMAGAETIFLRLLREDNIADQANYMLARVAFAKSDLTSARNYSEATYKASQTATNLVFVADLYWTTGDSEAFKTVVEEALENPVLALTAIGLIRKSGREADALNALDRQPESVTKTISAQSLRSAILLDLDDVGGAIVAGNAAIKLGARPEGNYDIVRALLAGGQVQEALGLIRAAKAADPLSQFWLAYETTALRMLGDARYGDLIDYERHVRSFELPVPEGFASLEAFNTALLKVIDVMNPLAVHPLNQSLRGGGQSPSDLCVSQDPVLRAYFKALDAPIRDYMETLGQEPDHPSSARNTGHYKFVGGWSVRLGAGGHHINHIHPRGWISSAYYVSVPDETAEGTSKAGWIKFGEPPIKTDPILGPEKWIQPKPGMVVLFPSFLWHGTEPIHDGSVRVTAPFDVLPAPKGLG